jgi:hypothetical protein
VVTFCVDGNDNGCADAGTLSATVTKHWVAIADTVFLTFDGTAQDTTSLFTTCTTGDTTAENETGDRDNLLACTFDAVGLPTPVPASTDKPGGGRLQWFIQPAGGGEVTATRFAASPPRETGPDATAIARIEAFRGGNDFITVELQNEIGNMLDSESVQKRVTQTTRPTVRVDSSVTIRDRFRGRVNSTNARCRRGRLVKVKKRRPGRDRTIGQDRTNRRGRYVVRRPGANGRFYAKVVKKRVVRPNRIIVCRAARSRTIRR